MSKKRKLAAHEDDELFLTLRGNKYYLNGCFDGRRIRKSCGTTDLTRAKLVLENHKRELVEGWREDYDRADRDWATVAKMVHDRQKPKALQRGIPFDLKPAQIYSLMKSTGFRCAISGIPFAKRFAKTGERDPWAPSIDRIENRHGYTMDNVRVVSIAANIALSDWGFDVLFRLSRGIVRSSVTLALEPEESSHQLNNSGHAADKPLIRLVE